MVGDTLFGLWMDGSRANNDDGDDHFDDSGDDSYDI